MAEQHGGERPRVPQHDPVQSHVGRESGEADDYKRSGLGPRWRRRVPGEIPETPEARHVQDQMREEVRTFERDAEGCQHAMQIDRRVHQRWTVLDMDLAIRAKAVRLDQLDAVEEMARLPGDP